LPRFLIEIYEAQKFKTNMSSTIIKVKKVCLYIAKYFVSNFGSFKPRYKNKSLNLVLRSKHWDWEKLSSNLRD